MEATDTLPATPPTESCVDREHLRRAIRDEYALVASKPERGFHFHTGRPLAERLDYEAEWLDLVPPEAMASFAGTGNPLSMGTPTPGERVVDVACGAGMDSFIAGSLVGEDGNVIGIDMTPEMLSRARRARSAASTSNVAFLPGYGEQLPVPSGWADLVISNGALNLMPDKLAALREMRRVLRPGGRLQLADILVERPVNDKAKQKIDLWTG